LELHEVGIHAHAPIYVELGDLSKERKGIGTLVSHSFQSRQKKRMAIGFSG
jgi:hypothetical protein